jgi:voltage-gated potassium channel Kch
VNTWKEITLIWKDSFPPEKPRERSVLEKIITTVALVIAIVSLSQFKDVIRRRSLRASHTFMDFYVIAWFTLLAVLLAWGSTLSGLVVGAIAAYRIIDIVNYRVLFLFVKSEHKPWTAAIVRRSLAMVLTNFFEVVLGFAILYARTGSVVESNSGHILTAPTDALYFSLVTMTTVGFGDFIPATHVGRWLAMGQLLTTIIFVLFLVPALISVFSDRS